MIWWAHRPSLLRFIADFVAGEVARLRPGGNPVQPWTLTEQTSLGPGGIGVDSLEFVSLATALAEVLHLYRGGYEDRLMEGRCIGDWMDVAFAALDHFDDALTFRSSGSTGDMHPNHHLMSDLSREVTHLASLIGPCTRVLTTVPSHHIYGFLFTQMLPQRLGVPVVDIRGRLPGAVARELREGDLVIGYPDYWRAFARIATGLPAGIMGTSSTAALPRDVEDAARATGLSRLLQIYGCSEAGGIGWRDQGEDPYRLFPWWQRTADGVVASPGSPIALPDRLDWLSDDSFRVLGRLDGAVQVGGVNVFPARIARHLETHADVAAAAVRPMEIYGGVRLKAFVVPRQPGPVDVLRQNLQIWIDETLPPLERPRSLTFGQALPVNDMGKSADWTV